MIVSRTSRALIVERAPDIDTLFSDAKVVQHRGAEFRVLPHGLAETVMLRKLGIKAPNPMLLYYDWNGQKPFNVQKATCDLLTTNHRAYCLNDMGTGKTKAALWAWDYLNSVGQAGKLIITAPLSTLRFVWMREVFTTLPHRKVAVLHGTREERQNMLATDADIYVINHDGIKVLLDELRDRPDIDCLVIDELAVFRNNTQRSKLLRQYAAKRKWVWGMSGSPMPNQPTDVWMQGIIVNPTRVPRYFSHARDELMVRIDEFHWKPKPGAVDRAYEYLQPAVRFTLEDVVEIPPVYSQDVPVQLSTEQANAYTKLAKEFLVLAQQKKITAANAGAAAGKLLQISGGWVYAADKSVVALDNTLRLKGLLDAVESTQRKVMIFAPFIHTVNGISAFFAKKNSQVDHAVVFGDTKNREEIFGEFQGSNKYKALVAHPKCMAHGLTLTAADTIIWFLPMSADLELYEQANARITRVGQKFTQHILHLVATPVEKKLYRMLRGKQLTQNAFLSLFEDASIMEVE